MNMPMNDSHGRSTWGPLTAAVALALAALAALAAYVSLGTSYADAQVHERRLSATAVTAQQAHTYLTDCSHQRVVMPRNYTLTCGDANSAIENVHWRSWTATKALARGTYVENECEPDCADGKIASYPVRIKAGHVIRSHGHGRFTRIVVRFTHGAPSWVKHHRAVFDVDNSVQQ